MGIDGNLARTSNLIDFMGMTTSMGFEWEWTSVGHVFFYGNLL
jgi:hypothetical protein